MKDIKVLAIINFVVFITTVIVNQLALALPINGMTTGELSDMYPNLFVPAGITFSIWGIIYLFMLAFCVHQLVVAFQSSKNELFIRKIGLWFIVSSVANCSWILAWHYVYTELSLLIMLLLLFSLIKIYLNLYQIRSNVSSTTKWLVITGFSIYFGWITVATIANTTAVLVDWGWEGGLIGASLWTMIMMSVAIGMGIYFAIFRFNIAYTLVVIWALYGIYLKRTSDIELEHGIILLSQIGMIVSALSLAYPLYKKVVKSNQ